MKKLFTVTAVLATSVATAQDTDMNMGVDMNINMNINVTETYSETHTGSTTTTTNDGEDHYIMQGYSGAIGCAWPMDESQFTDAKNSIASKDFEDSKLTVAKQITGSNCLTASQVKEIMTVFDFEDSKLEYAKFAYAKTFDLGNYYKLNDAFDFESSIDELNEFINGQ